MRLRTQVVLTSASKSIKHIGVFVLAIFLTRFFTKYEYGTYLQVMLIANTALYIMACGIPSSVYYFLPRTGEKRRMMKNTISMMFLISFLVGVCVYLSSGLIASGFNNAGLLEFGWIIAAFIFLQIPTKLYEPFMIATQNVTRFVWVNSTFNIGFLIVILVPVLLGWSLYEVLFSLFLFFVAQLLVIGSMMIMTYHQLVDDPNGDIYNVKEQMSYSAPIGFSTAVSQLGTAIDKMIVSGYYDPEQLAVYARGAMEIPMLNVIANSLGNILMPKFVEEYQKGNKANVLRLWHSSIRMMAMFIYPSLVFLILTADHLIPFLFTDEYMASVIIFQVYTLGLITRITSYDSIVRAVGKTAILFKMALASVLLNILFTVLLIEMIGLVGAPLATVIVGTVLRFVYLLIITKLLEISLSQVFPWGSLARLLGASFVAALAIVPILMLDYSHATMLGITAAVFGLVYLTAFRFCGALDESERESVRGLFPKRFRWVL